MKQSAMILQKMAVKANVNDVLNTPGVPLSSDWRSLAGARFGHDFSRVRVHADDQAAASASSMNALAYTVGDHIVMGRVPGLRETDWEPLVLGHELAHVIQQEKINPRALHKTNTDLAESEASEAATQFLTDGAIHLSTAATGIQCADLENVPPIPPVLQPLQQTLLSTLRRLGGPPAGYEIRICNNETIISDGRLVSYVGRSANYAGGAETDSTRQLIWVHESTVANNGISRRWGDRVNLQQVVAHELGHAHTGSGSCAVASQRGSILPGLSAAERRGLRIDAARIAQTGSYERNAYREATGHEPEVALGRETAGRPAGRSSRQSSGSSDSEATASTARSRPSPPQETTAGGTGSASPARRSAATTTVTTEPAPAQPSSPQRNPPATNRGSGTGSAGRMSTVRSVAGSLGVGVVLGAANFFISRLESGERQQMLTRDISRMERHIADRSEVILEALRPHAARAAALQSRQTQQAVYFNVTIRSEIQTISPLDPTMEPAVISYNGTFIHAVRVSLNDIQRTWTSFETHWFPPGNSNYFYAAYSIPYDDVRERLSAPP